MIQASASAAGSPPRSVSPTTACSRLQWTFVDRTGRRLLPDTILLQAAVQRAAAHTELFGGLADVAVVAREHFLDERALGFLEGLRVARCRCGGRRDCL